MNERDNLDEFLLANATKCYNQLEVCNVVIDYSNFNFKLECLRSIELKTNQKSEIYQLLFSNMIDIYNNTWGWNEEEKRKELFSSGRFIL